MGRTPATAWQFRVRAVLPARGLCAMTIRVLLADDQKLIRAGFRVIDPPDALEVIGRPPPGLEAVDLGPGLPARRGADGHPDARPGRAGSPAEQITADKNA